jgi:hypothetical protein
MGAAMEDVSKINQTESVQPDKPDKNTVRKKKKKRRKPYRNAKKHFNELTKIVDETHKELENANSPFRLCVYQEGEDLFIDVVTIDETGSTRNVIRHDISHAQIEKLIRHIKSGTGLLFNVDA